MPDNVVELYPKPPNAGTGANALSDPIKALSALQTINELSLFPLRKQSLEQTNVRQAFDTWAAQNNYAMDAIGALAGRAQRGETLTADDIHHWTAGMARNSDPRAVPSSVLNAVRHTILADPAGINSAIVTMANRVAGPVTTAARVQAPPGEGGEPQQMPLGAAQYYGVPQQQPNASGATSGGAMPTGMPPGFGTAMEAGATAYSKDLMSAGAYQERVNPVRSNIALLSRMGEGDIGPGTEQWNTIRSGLQTWGLGRIAGIDPEKVRDFNELKKYMAQAASTRAQTFGVHTDMGLATTVSANPNASMDRLSALELSKVNLALERQRQAQILEFDQAVRGGHALAGQYNSWAARWNTQVDPRAFIYDVLTPTAQAKLKSSLNGAPPYVRDRFIRTIAIARKWPDLLGDVHE